MTGFSTWSTHAYVNPIVAVLLGWAVLGEPITMKTVAAAAVILVGVALVNVDWRVTNPFGLRRRLKLGGPRDY
jgi:drug/metabolite transporter (DMT)-like permease